MNMNQKKLRKSYNSSNPNTYYELNGNCGACMICDPSACYCYGEGDRWLSTYFTFAPGQGVEAAYRDNYGVGW